jgi:hypothetical protein
VTKLHPIAICILEMPGWRLRVWLAIVIILVMANLPATFAGLILWFLALPYLVMTDTLARMVVDSSWSRRRLEADHEDQAHQSDPRDAWIARLEVELADARAATHHVGGTNVDPVYRRVGLHPSAPDWLVQAPRTAYRRRLHQDVHPLRHRQQAHDRYIRAEEALERIGRLRA